jgi:hypothetical protein
MYKIDSTTSRTNHRNIQLYPRSSSPSICLSKVLQDHLFIGKKFLRFEHKG